MVLIPNDILYVVGSYSYRYMCTGLQFGRTCADTRVPLGTVRVPVHVDYGTVPGYRYQLIGMASFDGAAVELLVLRRCSREQHHPGLV